MAQSQRVAGMAWRRLRVCLGALLLLAAMPLAALPTVVIDPQLPRQALAGSLQVIPDPSDRFDWRDIAAGRHDALALPAARRPPNLGYVRHPYWVRVILHNPSDAPVERALILRRGAKHAQRIHLQVQHQLQRELSTGGSHGSGDLVSRHAVAMLSLPPGPSEVVIRVESRTGLSLDYTLVSADALERDEFGAAWLFGMLFGLLVGIALYVLALWGASRDPVYAWFTGFALTMAGYFMHFEGYAFVALWQPQQQTGGLPAPRSARCRCCARWPSCACSSTPRGCSRGPIAS